MLIPVRCWTCGKPIAHLWEEFKKKVAAGADQKKVLDDLHIERYCCRQMFIGQVDLIEVVGQFKRF